MGGFRFGFVSLLLWLLAIVPAAAQDLGKGPHLALRLVAETDTPPRAGEVTLAFAATPQPGWHSYWINPGDAGFATKAEWSLPYPVTAGPLQFPVPQRLMISGLMNYVYEQPYAILTTLKVGAEKKPGDRLPIQVKLSYAVCTDQICVPETQTLSTVLTVGDGNIPADRRAQFDQWRAALPKPLGAAATYQVDKGRLRLSIPYPAGASADDAYFLPLTLHAIDYAAPQRVAHEGDRLLIETTAARPSGPLEGLLSVGGHGLTVQAAPGQVPPLPAGAGTGVAAPGWQAALWAFLGAVLGGVILNVMPCVFPILSLKALSLARAGPHRAHHDALAYTAGVVLVCLALGGVLLGLRAAGSTAGWAFQLQDPRVILLLLLAVMGIALNLGGLFEMTTPGFVNRIASDGAGGAFMTGALAAFVATPCTGPFMGTALFTALVLPWPAALAVFAGLGLGIALPFLLLGFVPALRRRLPKPGAWMETLRRILSVPMFLTALALAWVLGKQAGVDGMALGLGAVLLLALGLWWAGRRQVRSLAGAWWPALPLIAVALGAIAIVRPAPPAAAAAKLAGAEPFSEPRLAELAAQNRPVFVYFTADWCVTCKVNEKAVIETEAVSKAFADHKVAVLVGDWTNGDAVLGRFIQAHGRAGVPLYLWYKPGSAAPQVLPQLLSQSLLTGLATS